MKQKIAFLTVFKIITIFIFLSTFLGNSISIYADEKHNKSLDVPYEPTHPLVIQKMLDLANPQKNDLLYDLGCGDGRIVIRAAQKYNVRGIGVDIDPQRIKEAIFRAQAFGVSARTTFTQTDIFQLDFRDAAVVTMYLLNSINLKLRPRILMGLKPGTKIVTHAFHMDDWPHDTKVYEKKARKNNIYLWIIPAKIGGVYHWKQKMTSKGKLVTNNIQLVLKQQFQQLHPEIYVLPDTPPNNKQKKQKIQGKILTAKLAGNKVLIKVRWPGFSPGTFTYQGTVNQKGMIRGLIIDQSRKAQSWHTKREQKNEPDLTRSPWQMQIDGDHAFLSGTIKLSQNKTFGHYHGTLVSNSGNVFKLEHVYLWGNSIYFRVFMNKRKNDFIFHGFIQNKSGTGHVFKKKDQFDKSTFQLQQK